MLHLPQRTYVVGKEGRRRRRDRDGNVFLSLGEKNSKNIKIRESVEMGPVFSIVLPYCTDFLGVEAREKTSKKTSTRNSRGGTGFDTSMSLAWQVQGFGCA
jgi:hypothetical protein